MGARHCCCDRHYNETGIGGNMADNNLYPVVDIPEYEEENEESDTEYKPSVAWV